MEEYETLPRVSESNDAQTSERSWGYTDLFGPAVGTYTPTTAERSNLPSDVQRALVGVALPVRERLEYAISSGSVLVSADEFVDV